MSAERVQKIMARCGPWSRRQAEALIREARVTVNGQAATLGQQADAHHDAIKIDGRRLKVPLAVTQAYILLNKPAGHVSTRHDPEGRPTVIDLLPKQLAARVQPVGRLDFDTEGLLLLTDDGALAHRVGHPRFGCSKTYQVKVKGRPAAAALERLRSGIKLDGRVTAPARIEVRHVHGRREASAHTWWTVTLNEGRTRQIREMFFRIGHPVKRLRRVAIGPLRDSALRPGTWRRLRATELSRLRAALASDHSVGGSGGTGGSGGKHA